jgi:glycerophosphoryl diester phosphodiesterase
MKLLRGHGPVIKVGHRGAPAVARENTLASLAAAAELGVDAVEIDVIARADGSVSLAHAREALDHHDVPTLDEALELVAERGIAVQLDLKGTGHEGTIADAVRRHGLLDRSFASTASPRSLLALAAAEPGLPRALTYPQDRLGIMGSRLLRPAVAPGLAALRQVLPSRLPRWLHRVGAAAATLNWIVVTPAVVRSCHDSGAAVYVWTVDDPALAQRLDELGADGIITNDPRIFARNLTS